MSELESILQSLYFFAPAFIANICPGFSAMLPGDKAVNLRYLGTNKTWYGLVSATTGGFITLVCQQYLVDTAFGQYLSVIDYSRNNWWLLGILFGFGAILGDWTKSFFKRRRGIKPGEKWFPFDQIDFLLGSSLSILPITGMMSYETYIIPLIAILIVHRPLNTLSYHMGIRKLPW